MLWIGELMSLIVGVRFLDTVCNVQSQLQRSDVICEQLFLLLYSCIFLNYRYRVAMMTAHSQCWSAILQFCRVAQINIPHWTKCNFSTTVWDLYTQISWFIWERSYYNSEFKKKYFSFLQSYGYINILCHIFNFARNNQQQLVIFIVKKHWLLLQIPESDK